MEDIKFFFYIYVFYRKMSVYMFKGAFKKDHQFLYYNYKLTSMIKV